MSNIIMREQVLRLSFIDSTCEIDEDMDDYIITSLTNGIVVRIGKKLKNGEYDVRLYPYNSTVSTSCRSYGKKSTLQQYDISVLSKHRALVSCDLPSYWEENMEDEIRTRYY